MPQPSDTQPHTVFVVDDDRDIREDLGDLLREEGFGVEAAWNGAEALNRLKAGFRPDVIILDIMMPVMDGKTFRGELQKLPELAGIPVIGLTAWPNQQLDFDCLQKPLRFETLLGRIRTVLA
ncbi:MAG TPA: response regulator [Polyangia bacterium]|jgi:CheY-like chemotaxis protein|nr:response regulator [Polyangia bacterium]